MDSNVLTSEVIGAAISVHQELGPGLLESVYHRCLVIELEDRGVKVLSEVPVPVLYKGRMVQEDGLRLDLIVENEVVVEPKSVEKLKAVHKKQLLTYLRLLKKHVGLLINFNEALLKDGVVRIVNGFEDPTTSNTSALSAPLRETIP